jgi:hypothetical protein
VIDVKTRGLLDELLRYPGVDPAWRALTPGDTMPIIPLAFAKGALKLSYFSMITTVGTPQTIAAEELRIESMFPADALTEQQHARFVVENTADGSSTQH